MCAPDLCACPEHVSHVSWWRGGVFSSQFTLCHVDGGRQNRRGVGGGGGGASARRCAIAATSSAARDEQQKLEQQSEREQPKLARAPCCRRWPAERPRRPPALHEQLRRAAASRPGRGLRVAPRQRSRRHGHSERAERRRAAPPRTGGPGRSCRPHTGPVHDGSHARQQAVRRGARLLYEPKGREPEHGDVHLAHLRVRQATPARRGLQAL